ncbi:MAG: Mut7-C RNAse domain-containing protein [Dehalococcoidia bacterium]|nr:Mut7-C RNAse domain-containing protein [Dehalococcoidia bacterium]
MVDSNVEKLGRWLRIAGFDAAYAGNMDDNRLVRLALDQGRILLTRDRGILKRRVAVGGRLRVVFIDRDGTGAQLRQVFSALQLSAAMRPFSRCAECNTSLLPKLKDEVGGLVPPYVYRTHEQYMQCPDCGRVYWRGTHWERMVKELEAAAEPA